MRKTRADKYREQQFSGREPETLNMEEFAAKLADAGRHSKKSERLLNPTQRDVIFSQKKVNAYMGAAGAAKTSSILTAGFLRALFQPGSKGAICRYDYNKHAQTTLPAAQAMLNVLPPGTLLGRDKSPPETWTIKPIIEGPPSTIYFMGLKDEVVGFEIDWAAVDEANEVEKRRILELVGRLRNFIPNMPPDADPYTLFLAFNPPDTTHWLYTACTGQDHKGRHVAPPWMDLFTPKFRENAKNLRSGYYEDLEEKYAGADDLKARFIMGQWGTTFPGDPVYRQFSVNQHVKRDLQYDPFATLYRFWDFGYNSPACVFAQLDLSDRLLVLYEIIGSKMEIQDFARHVKAETGRQFPRQKERVIDYGDPAVRQKKDTGSTLAELAKENITMMYKISLIDDGVRLIRQRLGLLIEGEPAIQFDEVGAPILINAMKGGYHLEEALRDNRKDPMPKKDGYYDHVSDAFRYGMVNLFGGSVDRAEVHNLPGNLGYGGEYDS